MSYESKDNMDVEVDPANDIIDENIIDEYQLEYEELDKSDSELTNIEAIYKYKQLLNNERFDEVAVKVKEFCLYKLAKYYTEEKEFDLVLSLLKTNNELFSTIPKARTAKIVRNILEIIAKIPDSLSIQIRLCKDVVEWCKLEKRTFLRQRIESKLAHLLLLQHELHAALILINSLLTELKKLDDKQMLTEVHLIESRIHHALRNVPKAKAALTASRTSAHAIYVTPNLQAELDEMSGVLHCEEGDYTTAYSYFYEAHDGYDQSNDPKALTCLQYMILCKVLNNAASDVPGLLSSKVGLKHTGVAIEAMRAIAKAATEKSLEKFKEAEIKYSEYVRNDHLISHNLDKLHDQMLESNLLKIIFPYSVVEITYIAKRINLPIDLVERKLSQMILDHTFDGILDQGKGELIIYDKTVNDTSYSRAVEIINNLSLVATALSSRASKLSKGHV